MEFLKELGIQFSLCQWPFEAWNWNNIQNINEIAKMLNEIFSKKNSTNHFDFW